MSIELVSTPIFALKIEITGDQSGASRTFNAKAVQLDHQITFYNVAPHASESVVIKQENGSWIEDGKIDFSPNWSTVGLFIDANVGDLEVHGEEP